MCYKQGEPNLRNNKPNHPANRKQLRTKAKPIVIKVSNNLQWDATVAEDHHPLEKEEDAVVEADEDPDPPTTPRRRAQQSGRRLRTMSTTLVRQAIL